jgi:hypothetical protein
MRGEPLLDSHRIDPHNIPRKRLPSPHSMGRGAGGLGVCTCIPTVVVSGTCSRTICLVGPGMLQPPAQC